MNEVFDYLKIVALFLGCLILTIAGVSLVVFAAYCVFEAWWKHQIRLIRTGIKSLQVLKRVRKAIIGETPEETPEGHFMARVCLDREIRRRETGQGDGANASDITCMCRVDSWTTSFVRCRFCKARLRAFDELLEIIEENDFYRSTEAREVVDNYRKEISTDGKEQ